MFFSNENLVMSFNKEDLVKFWFQKIYLQQPTSNRYTLSPITFLF